MANQIEIVSTSPSPTYVTAVSRYADSTVIYYGPENQLTFTTYVRGTYPPDPGDKFMVISGGDEYRPDSVSNRVYGLPDFWWKIMEANNIFDIFDFKSGVNIRLPANIY